MRKLILFVAALVVSCWTVCSAREFDAKLIRFITMVDGKFAPEISGDEAVGMLPRFALCLMTEGGLC